METLLPLARQAWAALLAPAFTLWGTPQTVLEVVAFALAIAMVLCNMRVNPVAWPLAIASSALYGALFWQQRLYGSAALQLLFIAVAFWGWWQWLRGHDEGGATLRVRHLTRAGLRRLVAALAVAWPLLALYLQGQTDSPAPWLDAFPTAVGVLGQWLLARKYVENWPAWVVANVAGVALYTQQGLWLTAVLYAVLLMLAFAGWRAWRRLAAAGLARAADTGVAERTPATAPSR